ncbi:hypothetical protein AALO_G00090190 [Alosa alosa]|uniref:Uncharacterized protein n=1 Tax=Alosa alosa TaxID=278164 RepID=A0AAV6GRV8_9TELE|nr:hypothetical protein AALO_G00090190 [Alosa alosa]
MESLDLTPFTLAVVSAAAVSLNNTRYQIYSRSKKPPKLKKLPPTDANLMLHMRAHLQVMLWKAAGQREPPAEARDITKFGWEVANERAVMPALAIQAVAPRHFAYGLMVSYKRLSPEEVHFAGCGSLDEPLAAAAEVEEKEADVDDVDVEAEQERPLLLGVLPCSITGALLTLGGLVLAVCAVWLLGTIVWLRSPAGTQGPHRPPPPPPARQDGCSSTAAEWRFDCYPERDVVVTQAMCESRNCCFIPVATASGRPGRAAGRLARVTTDSGDPGAARELLHETDQRLRVRLTDPVEKRYEVPIEVPVVKHKAPSPSYNVELRKDPFALIITAADTRSSCRVEHVRLSGCFIWDQFLQFSTSLPSRYVFGLGEHRSSFLHSVQWNTLTMWARDVPPTEYTNLYGVHPFYLCMESDGSAHGFFLLNSNAMDVVLQPAPAVTWRTIGGILDFYVFTGPDPSAVIGQYLEVIGRPAMPVYWAMGYHLCRWGYKSSNATWDVVKTIA